MHTQSRKLPNIEENRMKRTEVQGKPVTPTISAERMAQCSAQAGQQPHMQLFI